MRDPYDVLGVSRSASDQEIKSAFRKLAKTYHPDSNQSADAPKRFGEATDAYDLLSDADKRARFDRGEIDADGKPRFQGFGSQGFGGAQGADGYTSRGGGFDFKRGGDPFADFFSELRGFGGGRSGGGMGGGAGMGGAGMGSAGMGGGPASGGNLTGIMRVTFEEAMLGARKRVDLGGRVLDVTVPPGIEDGRQMRLRGQGLEAPGGGPAGDALITVNVASHPVFKRDGRNLLLDLPVTLDEAVLGAKVKTPTLEGPVSLTVPSGSNTGRVMRLRGKGVATKAGERGDILVTLKVVLPEDQTPLKASAEAIRAGGGYKVRKAGFDQ